MRYSIGSISKEFTAAAILLLQQQGKLSLDDKIAKFFPDLTDADHITLRQILSHTSGYQDYWPQDYLMPPMKLPTTPAHIMDTWAKKPLDFAPGSQWQYSNTGYVIAGAIVQKVTGETPFEFLQRHVFPTLGITDAYDTNLHALPDKDARGYSRFALGPLRPSPKEGVDWMFGAGELAMTASDLAKWDVAMIDQTLLQPASWRAMQTEVLLNNGLGSGYGLGVFVGKMDGHRMISHDGDAGLQHGKIDRDLFTADANSYFSDTAVHDYQTSLAPLGKPESFTIHAARKRGGMQMRGYTVEFPKTKLSITTYVQPDGKLEQYIVASSD